MHLDTFDLGGGGGAIFQISIFNGVFRKINILGDMKIFGGDNFGVATNFDSFSRNYFYIQLF